MYTYISNVVPIGREVNTIFDGPNTRLPAWYSEPEPVPQYSDIRKNTRVYRSVGPRLDYPSLSSRATPMIRANYLLAHASSPTNPNPWTHRMHTHKKHMKTRRRCLGK